MAPGSGSCHSVSVAATVRARPRPRGVALAFLVCSALSTVAPWSASAARAAQPGPALLTAVDVQDMGTFDRVTFTFRTTAPPSPLPVITRAEYVDRPVLADPSGIEVG